MNSSVEKNDDSRPHGLNQDLNLLREIDFFSGMPLDALKVLAYLCSREHFKAGDSLFVQGEDDGQAIFIISGRAGLVRGSAGRGEPPGEQEIIKDCSPGEFLGALTLLGRMPRLFTLKAVEDTGCLIIVREKFQKVLEQFPQLQSRVFHYVSERISAWETAMLARLEAAKAAPGADEPEAPDKSILGVSLI